ncbi:MAG: 4-(cytidine 5'-diphospho)-2-C-methyl-D-erythritol kinase [Candidatus Omnitrophica bacterium]|nr:4-(cytidine 5'-diphospho)-2-C-methyl-D-erythritol kinase [Candidatus Omnitrophota bacterium]MDD5355480.1 4-(cytidine 5'-diphospho)-2-C-methyl-D-erythritol kinase [Candidatus Omnitrophota bacterium]
MKQIDVLAPAKINLFLKILNRRSDGFHNIETVFEKVSLSDRIIFKNIPQNKVVVDSNIKSLCGKNSSVYKAACLIKEKFKINKGVSIYLDKNIPMAAGLGGGSSDAASTLKALNGLWKMGLSDESLLNLSRNIGSDDPLFILKGSFILGKGKGDKVSRIKGVDGLKLWHILIAPKIKVSTPFAYSLFDRHYLGVRKACAGFDLPKKMKLTMPPYGANIITRSLFNRDVSLLNYYSYNTFESLILRQFPKLAKIKKAIEEKARDFIHLSGSGSTLFITFSNRKGAEGLLEKIGKVAPDCRLFLVHTL